MVLREPHRASRAERAADSSILVPQRKARVNPRRLFRRRQRRTDLRSGERVLIVAWPYGAAKATLVTPTRWLWQLAWTVELDERGPLGTTRERVAEDRIVKLPIEA